MCLCSMARPEITVPEASQPVQGPPLYGVRSTEYSVPRTDNNPLRKYGVASIFFTAVVFDNGLETAVTNSPKPVARKKKAAKSPSICLDHRQ